VLALVALKAADWYFSRGGGDEGGGGVRPSFTVVPPPPGPPAALAGFGAIPPETCPLCKKALDNAAAAPSGLVYCYRCLCSHAKEHGSCPVTGVPCALGDVRKLYETA
jgi:peroxin-12